MNAYLEVVKFNVNDIVTASGDQCEDQFGGGTDL